MSAIDHHRDDVNIGAAEPARPAPLPPSNRRRRNQNEYVDPGMAVATPHAVRDAHRAVCNARLVDCHQPQRTRGRGISGRRARAADQWRRGASSRELTADRRLSGRHRQVSVLGFTAAVLLLYVAVLGTYGSQANQRLVDVGGLLIVICGALCLNAVTVASGTERTRHRTHGPYRRD